MDVVTDNHGELSDAVRATAASLRLLHSRIFGVDGSQYQARVVRAFARLSSLWESRLSSAWVPPDDSAFPWAQVRLSLAALLPGFAHADDWLKRTSPGEKEGERGVAALILAGNTPLLAWTPLAAALLAGHAVFVKQSRDEVVWTRLFVESLAEIDAELAALIKLDLWPGGDPRTTALVQAADAVIAYGSDSTLAALRRIMPNDTPFFGFGHAVSIGIIAPADTETEAVRGFARDVLMYDQAGCLSPHLLFAPERFMHTADVLVDAFAKEAETLEVAPVTDPAVAIAVHQARDMARFDGFCVTGDLGLRWTIIYTEVCDAPIPLSAGHGVVFIVPTADGMDILPWLGPLRGRISSAGIAGKIQDSVRDALAEDGVSRICSAGEMQTPPLDWPNGRIDLLAELRNIRRNTDIKGVSSLLQT